jgi:hypothetical protein
MNIAGTQFAATVTFANARHGEWKRSETVLSVDSVTVTLNVDGSISLKSRDGKLVLDRDTVMVYPGWYDPNSVTSTNTKKPVFRNACAVGHEIVQKHKNRTGYIFFFKESDEDVK